MKLREFDIDRDFDNVSRWFTLLGKTLLKKSSSPNHFSKNFNTESLWKGGSGDDSPRGGEMSA